MKALWWPRCLLFWLFPCSTGSQCPLHVATIHPPPYSTPFSSAALQPLFFPPLHLSLFSLLMSFLARQNIPTALKIPLPYSKPHFPLSFSPSFTITPCFILPPILTLHSLLFVLSPLLVPLSFLTFPFFIPAPLNRSLAQPGIA